MLHFYYIRHAESETNIDTNNRIGGHNLDTNLTPLGIEQSKLLGQRLKNIDIVYSSTAIRTQKTAQISLNTSMILDADLLEQYQGDWTGKSRSIYDRSDVRLALDADNWNFVPGDIVKGESHCDVAKRMTQWLYKKIDQYQGRQDDLHICIFSHGLAIKYMLTELMNWDKPSAYKIIINNTSVTHLVYNGTKLSLADFNNTNHLDPVKNI
jgi:broad specificity phosphatase PhoE